MKQKFKSIVAQTDATTSGELVPLGQGDQTATGAPLASGRLEQDVLTRNARALLPAITDTGIAQMARLLIATIEDSIRELARQGKDTSMLPPLHGSISEDGSVLLEWMMPDLRVGFSLEHDPAQSGWYRVGLRGLKGLGGHYEPLTPANYREIVAWAVSQVSENT